MRNLRKTTPKFTVQEYVQLLKNSGSISVNLEEYRDWFLKTRHIGLAVADNGIVTATVQEWQVCFLSWIRYIQAVERKALGITDDEAVVPASLHY